MEPIPIPWFMILLFMISVVFFVGAVIVLYVMPRTEYAKRVPMWLIQAAYPALMLCLPIVMLMVTMMLFPCFWQHCK